MNRAALLVCLLALCACRQSTEGLVREGDTELGRGNLDGALQRYRQAYRQAPQHPLVLQRVEQLGFFSGIRLPKPRKKPAVPSQSGRQGADGGHREQAGDQP